MTLSEDRADAGLEPAAPRPPARPVGRRARARAAFPQALAGVLAAALALGSSVLVSALLHEAVNPVVGIAELVRDLTPGALAEQLIHLVGHLDKPLLIAGTVLFALAVSAVLGLQPIERSWITLIVVVALGALGYVGVQARPSTPLTGTISSVVGIVVWLAALSWLVPAARAVGGPPPPVDPSSREAPVSTRRTFLVRAAVVGAGAAITVGLSRVAGAAAAKVQKARVLLRLPVTRGAVPTGADLSVPGAVPWRTSNGGFYLVHTAISAPQITPKDYRLRIHGMVDRPLEITYGQLADRRLTEDWITLCCVSNEVGGDLIGNAHWSGVPIRELLEQAGVQDGADAVKQTSADGWTCGTPLSALTDPRRNAMLALAMNGEPLPVDHGFPVRMVVPGLYGYVSATKWLVDLEVTRFEDFSAYWTTRGWGERGPVKTESRIDIPQDGMGLQSGKHAFGGVAWAQHKGIAKVEVRLDGKAWQETELGRVPDNDTWVQWKATFDLEPGEHRLAVRATDRTGYTQTPARADVLPDGATGWHEVSFSVG